MMYLQGLGTQMAQGFDAKTGPQAMLSGTRVRGCQKKKMFNLSAGLLQHLGKMMESSPLEDVHTV